MIFPPMIWLCILYNMINVEGIAPIPPLCLSGINLPNGDLPNMPVTVAAGPNPEAKCAQLCLKEKTCSVYSFHTKGCSDHGETCALKNGCCWLKSIEVSGIAPVINKCVCSGYARIPPSSYKPPSSPPSKPVNVLYVLVDDLRPEMVPYGQNYTYTPNLAKLAINGTIFRNAYCQISVCSPSRQSFLTGRRPDTSGVWNFIDHFRQADCGISEPNILYSGVDIRAVNQKQCDDGSVTAACGGSGNCCSLCSEDPDCKYWSFKDNICHLKSVMGNRTESNGYISGMSGHLSSRSNWTSIPGNFKRNGYVVAGTGKIFHTEEGGSYNNDPNLNGPGMPPNEDPRSWSDGLSMAMVNAVANMWGCSMPSTKDDGNCAINATIDGTVNPGEKQLCDKTIADDAIMKLRMLSSNYNATGQPFFLAVGFRKPHLSFRFPQPWLSKFPSPKHIPVAKYPTMDTSVPPIAHRSCTPQSNPYEAEDTHVAEMWRLYYMGAIAWMDSQLGRVLDELDMLGLHDNTLIILHSDHGWNLGEHGDWQKFTNWELGTRVPLLMRVPWLPQSKGKTTNVLAELIDIFPTMNALTRIPTPPGETLDGISLLPVLQKPDDLLVAKSTKQWALSQYMRCPSDTKNSSNFWKDNICLRIDRLLFPFMGYTLRTDEWRFTEWVRWDGKHLRPNWDELVGHELYSHIGDDGTDFDAFENVNEAQDNPTIVHKLSQQLHTIVDKGKASYVHLPA